LERIDPARSLKDRTVVRYVTLTDNPQVKEAMKLFAKMQDYVNPDHSARGFRASEQAAELFMLLAEQAALRELPGNRLS